MKQWRLKARQGPGCIWTWILAPGNDRGHAADRIENRPTFKGSKPEVRRNPDGEPVVALTGEADYLIHL